jgi:hypothetical protein
MYKNPQIISVISKIKLFFQNLLENKVGKPPRIVVFLPCWGELPLRESSMGRRFWKHVVWGEVATPDLLGVELLPEKALEYHKITKIFGAPNFTSVIDRIGNESQTNLLNFYCCIAYKPE